MKVKNLNLIFLILLLCSGIVLADNPRVKGYYVNMAGDTAKVMIEVPTAVLSNNFHVSYAEYGIQCVDKKGKKLKLDKDNAQGFGFNYEGIKYTFQFVPALNPYTFVGITYYGEFLNLVVDGKCKLYYKTLRNSTNSGSSSYDEFLFWKAKDDIYITKSGMMKLNVVNVNEKSLDEFFSDCQDLVTRIKKKEFKKGDDKYIRLAKYYNNDCQGVGQEQEQE